MRLGKNKIPALPFGPVNIYIYKTKKPATSELGCTAHKGRTMTLSSFACHSMHTTDTEERELRSSVSCIWQQKAAIYERSEPCFVQ